MLSTVITAVAIYAMWKLYEKLGMEGWKSIIPFYSWYCLFENIYGDGWKFLYMLIPFYGIYVYFKLWAHIVNGFGKSKGYLWGIAFLSPIFICILGLDSNTEWLGEDNTIEEYEKTAVTCTIVTVVLAFLVIISVGGIMALIIGNNGDYASYYYHYYR